jgi:hypothetical protein
VLAVREGSDWRYPACQFHQGEVLPGIADVVQGFATVFHRIHRMTLEPVFFGPGAGVPPLALSLNLSACGGGEATCVSSDCRGAPWGQVTAVALLGAISRDTFRRDPNDRVVLS